MIPCNEHNLHCIIPHFKVFCNVDLMMVFLYRSLKSFMSLKNVALSDGNVTICSGWPL